LKLLILGAGQYGAVAKEIAEAMNCYEKIDFLDDNNVIAVGKISDYQLLRSLYDSAVVAIGNSKLRINYIEKLKKAGYEIPNLIHPKSYVSPSVKIGVGCIIEPFAGINANVEIGIGCLFSMGCLVNHNALVENGCHIDCGAIVSARELVPEGTKVISGMVFRNEI